MTEALGSGIPGRLEMPEVRQRDPQAIDRLPAQALPADAPAFRRVMLQDITREANDVSLLSDRTHGRQMATRILILLDCQGMLLSAPEGGCAGGTCRPVATLLNCGRHK